MIPRDYITEWRSEAPWIEDSQVEQDLVISRALVEMFSSPLVAQSLAFRGGTALYKLYLTPAARYSEDIDLVQIEAEPAGPVMDALRTTLDHWLGRPTYRQATGRITFVYRFLSEGVPTTRLRLKVEINTREHVSILGHIRPSFSVASRWYTGAANVTTFHFDELLATKLRALYQRKKGRDLFDLAVGLEDERSDPERIVATFQEYMTRDSRQLTRAVFERNLANKLADPQFRADVNTLVVPGDTWSLDDAASAVSTQLISLLPGDSWKGPGGTGGRRRPGFRSPGR